MAPRGGGLRRLSQDGRGSRARKARQGGRELHALCIAKRCDHISLMKGAPSCRPLRTDAKRERISTAPAQGCQKSSFTFALCESRFLCPGAQTRADARAGAQPLLTSQLLCPGAQTRAPGGQLTQKNIDGAVKSLRGQKRNCVTPPCLFVAF